MAHRDRAADPQADDGLPTLLWCAGRPLLERRPLEPAEVALLGRRVAALRRKLALLAAAGVLLASAPLALGAVPGWDVAVVAYGPLVLGGLLAAIGIVPILALEARDRWGDLRRHARDLAVGEALVFAPAAVRAQDRDSAAPAVLKDFVPLVVFAASRTTRVATRSGGVRLRPIEVREVAAPPSYSLRVAVPREIAWVPGDPEARFQRRSLTEAETVELRRYVARFRRPRLDTWVALGFLAFSAGAWIAWVRSPFRALATYQDILGGVLGLAVGLLGVSHYLRLRHLAARLARDLMDGWVLALARSSDPERDADARPDADEREFLPNSRLAWSESGEPAGWRGLLGEELG